MSLSDYLEDNLLDHMLGTAAFTSPTDVYVSAHTADPGETGASESADFSRVLTDFAAASGGVANPTADVTLTNSGSSDVIISHLGVWDASSGGNFLVGGAMAEAKTVPAGEKLTIPAADFDVTLD